MTMQFRDLLIYENKEYDLTATLLSKYFITYPEKTIKTKYSVTALYRGYVATFEIRNNLLFVNEIEQLVGKNLRFKRVKKFDYQQYCNWFSGFVRILDRNQNYYNEFDKTIPYVFLEFNEGCLVKKHDFTYESYKAFKDVRYEKFKLTDKYTHLFSVMKSAELDDEEAEQWVYDLFDID